MTARLPKTVDFEKVLLVLQINWGVWLAFVTLWVYGFYGAVGFSGILYPIQYLQHDTVTIGGIAYYIRQKFVVFSFAAFFLPAFILALFLFLSQRQEYRDRVILKVKDCVVFFSYLLILLPLSLENLTNSLVGDQIYHAQASQKHSIFAVEVLSSAIEINTFSFSSAAYMFNFLFVFVLLTAFLALIKANSIKRILVVTSIFLLFRFVAIIKFGGDVHPPFRLFPLWLSSSFLSFTDFAFRLPSFLMLLVLMWAVQRMLHRTQTFLFSWLIGLVVGTIPVLWHVGTLVEQSIWTASIWTILLLALYEYSRTRNSFHWVRWFSLISIFALMRQSAFVGLVPIILALLFEATQTKDKYSIKSLAILVAPILVMLPFITKSIIGGTPATYVPGEVDFIPVDASSLERILIAVTSGFAPQVIYNSVPLPWIVFLLSAFIPVRRQNIISKTIVFTFFACTFYIFYSIRPVLWGAGRYQAEYIIPFVVLGFVCFIHYRVMSVGIVPRLIIAGTIALIVYNLHAILAFPPNSTDQFITAYSTSWYRTTGMQSEIPYDYREALQEVKKSGFAGSTYIAGVTYGTFQEIINGFAISEIEKTNRILLEKSGRAITCETISSNNDINVVLISDSWGYGVTDLASCLEETGWKHWKDFHNEKYGSTIVGMVRER